MRAEQEYMKWCGGYSMSAEERKAYVAGFKRAVELAEEILKRQGEDYENNDEEV